MLLPAIGFVLLRSFGPQTQDLGNVLWAARSTQASHTASVTECSVWGVVLTDI